MGFFGRRDGNDEYRPAKDGEKADFTLNGEGQVYKKHMRGENPDDGGSGIINPGDKDANKRFGFINTKGLIEGERRAATRNAAARRGMGGAIIVQNGMALTAVEKQGDDGKPEFKNAVLGAKQNQTSRINKGFLKRNAIPTVVVGIVITAVGIMMGGTQSLMPFSLVAQLKGQFDTIGVSTNFRSRAFLKMQLDGGRVKNCTKSTIFGSKKFDLSKRQIAKLADNGITYDKKSKTLNFVDVDGSTKAVTAKNFEATYNSNEKFRSEYYEGSKTWRGAVSDWFDEKATKILEFMGFKRNKYPDRITGDADADDANFKSNVESQAFDGDASGGAKSKDSLEDTKNEDNEVTGTKRTQNDDEMAELALSKSDAEVDQNGRVKPPSEQSTLSKKLNGFAEGYGKVTGIASAAAQTTCGVLNIVSAIGAVVAAIQTVEVIKTAAAVLEIPDKQESGAETSEVPINSLATMLVTVGTTTHMDRYDNKVTKDTIPMEGESVKSTYEGRAADASDPSVRSFNFSTMLSDVSKGLSLVQSAINLSITSFKACTYAKLAAAAVDVVGDILEVAACIASFGIGCAVSALKSAALSIGFSLLIQTIVKAAVPWVAQILARNVLKDAVGEDLGNAIVDGGMKMMSSNHQYGGGSFMDEKGFSNFITYQAGYQQQIAQYERENLSPFDLRSKNTFLGSIVNKLIPITTQTGGIFTRFTSITNTVSKSISSLMPNAIAIDSAVTASEAAERTNYYCPFVSSVGAVADEYCNPYVGTDVTTIGENYDPADVVNKIAAIDDNLGEISTVKTENGVQLADITLADDDEEVYNAPIRENSRLANYIQFCPGRQSLLGMPDQNVIDKVDGTSTGSSLGDSVLGAIPILGDIIDAISNAIQLLWYGFISGEACVMNNKAVNATTYIDKDGNVLTEAIVENENQHGILLAEDINTGLSPVPSWSEAKYYQRYIEDQRLAESSGLIEKSAVTAYLEKYYEEHPLDNSYEGILARYSGLRKDQVVLALDILDYQKFLAEYNPEEMFPLTHDKEEADYTIEDGETFDNIYVIANNNYYDIGKRRLATIG